MSIKIKGDRKKNTVSTDIRVKLNAKVTWVDWIIPLIQYLVLLYANVVTKEKIANCYFIFPVLNKTLKILSRCGSLYFSSKSEDKWEWYVCSSAVCILWENKIFQNTINSL